MYDVVVIGAGVVGGLIARELTKYDLKICLLEKEKDVAMGATKANSAIVHAGFDAVEGSLKAKLNVKGSEMMEQVTAELGVKYIRNGSIVVGFSQEDEQMLQILKERGEKNGVKSLQLLKGEKVFEEEPNLGKDVTCALLAPTGAIVCPYELCIAAVGNAMDNGAELKLGYEVENIVKTDDGFEIKSASESVYARYVVNCAGVWSDKIAAMVGDVSFTITPRRGEYMLLDKECGSLVKHTVFRCPSKMGKGVLVTPTVDGNLLIGPSAENIDDKENKATTAKGLADIRAKAQEQACGIDFSKVITSFTGLRSVGSSGDFIINTPFCGFINAAGIESPGLSASPAIAQYVVNMLKDSGLNLEKNEAFVGQRRPMHWFSSLSDSEKNEIIKESPEYAHIICRCEGVSEGEILYALNTQPKPVDVDGIKRRTRATMGRCQGGFCTPYIVELLAKAQGIDYGEVTKFGGNSRLNVGKTK